MCTRNRKELWFARESEEAAQGAGVIFQEAEAFSGTYVRALRRDCQLRLDRSFTWDIQWRALARLISPYLYTAARPRFVGARLPDDAGQQRRGRPTAAAAAASEKQVARNEVKDSFASRMFSHLSIFRLPFHFVWTALTCNKRK